ncbi:retrovirus-related pol polyprotein from transposon TNT 1-94 [Tanacetum coccineum]
MAYGVSWKSKLSTLNDENVLLKTQVDSVIQERENIKLEFQKLFNSIKATLTQHQKEVDELIEHVNQKTYAYADVCAQNQDLLMIISELKNKLRIIEKGKNVNTGFDKSETLEKYVCVTPFNKNIAGKAKNVSNTKVNADSSIGVEGSNSVRRPKSKDTKSKNRVLKNTNDKSSSAYIQKMSSSVSIDSNKCETMNSTDAQTMLIFSKTPEFIWAEAIATACFTQNRSIVHTRYNKTPYELIRGRKPNIQYFHVFRSLCYPTNDHDDLGKIKPKAEIGIFIGYSESSRGFRIYNRRTKKIMETIHVKFDELTAMASECNNSESKINCTDFQDSSEDSQSVPSKTDLDNLFGPLYEEYYATKDEAPQIVSSSAEQVATEPNSPILNENTNELVQKDVAEFDGNVFYNPPQTPINIITVKWIWKNKTDAENTVIRSKSHLVAKGYGQGDGIDLHQLQDSKLEMKFFLGLQVHQSPRGIFICQSQYTMDLLKKHGMEKCDIVSTLMATTKLDADLQVTQVDQIKYHGMIGGLMYLTASRPDIAFATFVCARYQARPTEKPLKEVKRIFRYLRETINMGLSKNTSKRLKGSFDTYDCKSTSEGIQVLGDKLVSWSSKKQDCTSMSTAKAECISLYA